MSEEHNRPAEHQLWDDEQGDGEIDNAHTVEQQGDDQAEHIRTGSDGEQGERYD